MALFRTEVVIVARPVPVLPIPGFIAQAAATEVRPVVSWLSYSSVRAPGDVVVKLVLFQVMLLPPAEPIAWPRKIIAELTRRVDKLFVETLVDVVERTEVADTSKGVTGSTPENARIAPDPLVVPLPMEKL